MLHDLYLHVNLKQTGDPRYKYLEHAVYVGRGRMVTPPAGDAQGGRGASYEIKMSCLAA